MYAEFTVLGYTGRKTFQGEKGDTIEFAKVTVRTPEKEVIELKASPSVDFAPYLDKKVQLHLKLLRAGIVRVEGVK